MTRSRVQVRLTRVSVPALVFGDRLVLVDATGNRLSKWIDADRVAVDPDPEIVSQWEWNRALTRLKAQLAGHLERQARNPWQVKCATLAKSFSLRARDLHRPRGRCRFERYSTTTWGDAAHRLSQQAQNRARYGRRPPWVRWAQCVANNHNKRKGGRYAQARYRDEQADSRTDREATVSLPTERTHADPGNSVA